VHKYIYVKHENNKTNHLRTLKHKFLVHRNLTTGTIKAEHTPASCLAWRSSWHSADITEMDKGTEKVNHAHIYV